MRSIVLSLVLLCACQFSLEPEEYTPQLVIHGLFTPDSVWSVRISKSIALEESSVADDLFLGNAVVTVTNESGRSEELEHTGSGQYRTVSNQFPQEGENYTIKVVHPELSAVQATSQAPPLNSEFVGIESLKTETSDDLRFRMRFRVQDLPGKSYYQVTLFELINNCNADSGEGLKDSSINEPAYEVLNFDSSDPALFYSSAELDEPIDFTSGAAQDFYAAVFSDRLFENAEREIEITFVSASDGIPSTQAHFMLVVSAMSEEWIQFDRTVTIQDLYLFVPDPIFANPVEIFSNVTGGLGIFAGYTNHAYRIDHEGNTWSEDAVCS
ncbi:MAG: DUF4249 domain-containing protein [Bacteroidetes bacterium]|nr:DUF4249 domain-containing protein [Bacteroidota bacterium]